MSKRRDLIVEGVVEAARGFMAEQLRAERRNGPADLTGGEADALQTLRDALAVERRTRGGRP